MKIKLKTEALKVAAAKAAKGSGNLSTLAITASIGIEIVGTDLVLTTTNNVNNLEVILKNVVKESIDFYACTNSDLFCKLVSKQTCETITLDLMENCLQFTGDGVYNLPLIQDEEGTMARIVPIEVDTLSINKIDSNSLKKLLKYNKLSISKQYDTPMYTGYCVTDDKVFTYNGNTACVTEIVLGGIKMLISNTMADLFTLFEDKTVDVYTTANKVKFESSDVVISGALLEGLEEFPTDPLMGTAYSDEFTAVAEISKQSFVNVLDRLSLFVDEDKHNAIELNFSNDVLIISDDESSACESVAYIGEKPTQVFDCKIDINDIKLIVNSISTDTLKIIYGQESGIGICSDNMRFIISILGEDDEEEEETVQDTEGEESEE